MRRLRLLVFATCVAGCGGFLGLTGDDDDDDVPPPPATSDASLDGRDDEGGTNVPGSDAGDGGAKKDAAVSNNDAAWDANKTDAADGSFDGSPSNVTFRYLFVTSMEYAGTFGIGGEVAAGADADALCKARGDASQLPKIKGRTWRAWVSTASPVENAAQRISTGGSLPFHLPDETVVATGNPDLIDGTLAHAIDQDESGVGVASAPVWTGSTAAGTLANLNCSDWASAMGGATGRVGTSASTTGSWSDGTDRGCAQLARLYCFEF